MQFPLIHLQMESMPKRIELGERMVLTVVPDHPIGIIHPVGGRSEMKLRSPRLPVRVRPTPPGVGSAETDQQNQQPADEENRFHESFKRDLAKTFRSAPPADRIGSPKMGRAIAQAG